MRWTADMLAFMREYIPGHTEGEIRAPRGSMTAIFPRTPARLETSASRRTATSRCTLPSTGGLRRTTNGG